ncbi:MAG: energy transducer TonB [Bacteroides sp.]|nr:energy transducer TonB [Bacteroides sp.]MCM1379763.1 energy transducer TonB [Bacteroides sp.]MCM1445696.1 energy transducer TonB [Prevotella sp.]
MAKDVDLSSREWTDLIFEGKNKEFGAYQLRNSSVKRHNLAMLSVVVVIVVALLLSLLVSSIERAEETITGEADQEMVSVDTTQDDTEEPEDEPEERFEEPEVEEVLPEEVLNTVKVTEIAIVDDDQVTKEDEVKTQEDLTQTETAFGASDFDKGTDDVTVVREIRDEVVVEEKKPEPEKIFTAVEESPKFPGGDAELYKWLSKNIRYPEMAAQNNIQGRVTVQFVVEKDGSVGEVKVVRGKDPDLDKEAVRVVKSLPKFIPGKMNGQSVRVWYTLPIMFKLQN